MILFVVGFFMPTLKNCRLKHIQDILTKKKKVLIQEKVSAKKVPSWPELSVKNCYHEAVESLPGLLDYLPDPHGKEQKLPERDFFLAVMYTLYSD